MDQLVVDPFIHGPASRVYCGQSSFVFTQAGAGLREGCRAKIRDSIRAGKRFKRTKIPEKIKEGLIRAGGCPKAERLGT